MRPQIVKNILAFFFIHLIVCVCAIAQEKSPPPPQPESTPPPVGLLIDGNLRVLLLLGLILGLYFLVIKKKKNLKTR